MGALFWRCLSYSTFLALISNILKTLESRRFQLGSSKSFASAEAELALIHFLSWYSTDPKFGFRIIDQWTLMIIKLGWSGYENFNKFVKIEPFLKTKFVLLLKGFEEKVF